MGDRAGTRLVKAVRVELGVVVWVDSRRSMEVVVVGKSDLWVGQVANKLLECLVLNPR